MYIGIDLSKRMKPEITTDRTGRKEYALLLRRARKENPKINIERFLAVCCGTAMFTLNNPTATVFAATAGRSIISMIYPTTISVALLAVALVTISEIMDSVMAGKGSTEIIPIVAKAVICATFLLILPLSLAYYAPMPLDVFPTMIPQLV